MVDVEKIKKGLDVCGLRSAGDCTYCPYFESTYCDTLLASDAAEYIESLEERIAIKDEALEALEQRCKELEKRNEPIEPIAVPIGEDVSVPFIRYKCPKCDMFQIEFKPNYCSYCGQAVKWE